MLIQRTFTTNPVVRLRGEMDRLFEDWFDRGLPTVPFETLGLASFPAINLREDAGAFSLEAELPGLTIADIELSVLGNELTIKGEQSCECDDDAHYHRRERRTGSFERVITPPVQLDVEKLEATLVNGVLTITMPKAQAVLPRKIEVKG